MDPTSRPLGASPGTSPGGSPQNALLAPPQSQQAPEQQLTWALAHFQAEVTAIPTSELGAVAAAAKPALRAGISWSARLGEQYGRSRLQVTVRHAAGAELSSETWATEASDLADTAGLLLALLLGIPVAEQPWAVKPSNAEIDAAADKPAGAPIAQQGQLAPAADLAEPNPQEQVLEKEPGSSSENADATAASGLEPLSTEEIGVCHRQILALPPSTRREFTAAFREHFAVPRSARSIGDRINQRQHGRFLEHFLAEAQDPADGQDQVPGLEAAPLQQIPSTALTHG